MIYTIGDTIFFLSNNEATSGIVSAVAGPSGNLTYTVIDSQSVTHMVAQADAYPSAFSLVTPTPTPSASPDTAQLLFHVGDTIFFLNGSAINLGICTSILDDDGNVYYILALADSTIVQLPASQAYPSSYSLASPTPTPSHSVTPTLTRTPLATATPSMTPSGHYAPLPNLFDATDINAWSSTSGTITLDQDGAGLVFTSTVINQPLSFTRSFSVNQNTYYNFAFDFEQGTIRYLRLTLKADRGNLLSMSRAEINHGDIIVYGYFGDSGRFNADVFVPSASNVSLTVEFFGDSNFNNYPPEGYTFKLQNTNFKEIFHAVSLTPSATVPPSATPSATPSPTPTKTPNFLPLTGYAKMVIADTPLIFYKFDERSGNAVIDYSGNNINGTYDNVIIGQDPLVNGPGFAALFGGASPSYVVASNDNRYKTIAGDFTIEFSLKGGAQANTATLTALPINSSSNAFSVTVENNKLIFNLTTSVTTYSLNSNLTISDNVARMVSFMRRGNVLNIYSNGIKIATMPVSGTNLLSRNFIYVGGLISVLADNYVGVMDDYSLYKYALTDFQISNHYVVWQNSSSPALTPTPTPSTTPSTDAYKQMILAAAPMAYYRLDEPDGTNVYDSIGNNNGVSNGELFLQIPSLLNNYTDKATASDGTGLVSVRSPVNLSYATNDFTIEFLAKINSNQISATPTLFGKIANGDALTYNYGFRINNGVGEFVTSSNGNLIVLSTIDAINDNLTRMIHVIRSGRVLSIYVNNVLVNSIALDVTTLDTSDTNSFEIFGSEYATDRNFVGTLDELAIYNYALNSSVVTAHYNFAVVVTPTPTATRSFSATPTPTKTNTPTRTITPTATPTHTVTPTHSLTPSITPTISTTPSITPTISVTPSVTATISVTPTISTTPSITPTISTTPSVTKTLTPTVTPTKTFTPTPTPTHSPTPSISVTPSITPTISETPSLTPTSSITPTVSPTISVTPSITKSATVTPTISLTPTHTKTATHTPTPTISITASTTPTPTVTRTSSITPTVTPTISVTTTTIFDPDAQSLLNSMHNWWDMDEATSDDRVDSKDGVLLSPTSVSSVTGLNGNAASFNPSLNPLTNLSSNDSENLVNYGDSSFTIGAMVKLSSSLLDQITYNELTIISRWSETKKQVKLGYDKSLSKFFFSISDNGDNVATVYAAAITSASFDTWLLVTGSYDTSDNVIRVSVNTSQYSDDYASTYYGVTQDFVIGNDGFGDSAWTGAVDSAFICFTSISISQLTWLYNAGAGTDWNRLITNAFLVDKGQLVEYYDGTTLTDFTNVNGVVNNGIGNPQPSFQYGAGQYSYKSIALGSYFQRINFDVMVEDESSFDMFFANDVNGSGNYLRLTSKSGENSGISACLAWDDYNEPAALSLFEAIDSNTWYNTEIRVDYIDNIRYISVYVNSICKVYYYPIPDSNTYFGFNGDTSTNSSYVDNIKIYSLISRPDLTATPTPTPTHTPTPTNTPTVTATNTPTPSVTSSITVSLSSSLTPTPTVTTTRSPDASPTPSATISVTVTPTTTPNKTAITAQYFRVSISNNNGGTFVAIPEMQFFDDPTNSIGLITDHSLPNTIAHAFASSSANSANAQQFAFDNDATTKWTAGFSTSNTAYLGWGFDTPTEVSAFSIMGNYATGDQANFAPMDFTLEYSYDNVTWYVGIAVTGQTGWAASEIRYFGLFSGFIPPTPSPTPTMTATPTVTPSVTASITPTLTMTKTVTVTPTISLTPSVTKTVTATVTPTITTSVTVTPTITPTITPSITPSSSTVIGVTSTPTPTPTPSVSPSVTLTISVTPSITLSISVTASPSLTPTITPSISVSNTPNTGSETVTVYNAVKKILRQNPGQVTVYNINKKILRKV